VNRKYLRPPSNLKAATDEELARWAEEEILTPLLGPPEPPRKPAGRASRTGRGPSSTTWATEPVRKDPEAVARHGSHSVQAGHEAVAGRSEGMAGPTECPVGC
jgi:hypothetical protein